MAENILSPHMNHSKFIAFSEIKLKSKSNPKVLPNQPFFVLGIFNTLSLHVPVGNVGPSGLVGLTVGCGCDSSGGCGCGCGFGCGCDGG